MMCWNNKTNNARYTCQHQLARAPHVVRGPRMWSISQTEGFHSNPFYLKWTCKFNAFNFKSHGTQYPPPVSKFAAYRVNLLFALNNNVGLQQESWGTLPGLRRLAVGWHSRQCCATPSCWRHSCTTNSPDWYQQRPLQVAQRYQQASSMAVGRVPTTKHARRKSLKTDAMRWTAPDMSVPLFQKTFSS